MKLLLTLLVFFSHYLLAAQSKDTIEIGFVYWKKDDAPQKYNAYMYGIQKAISEINQESRFAQDGFKVSVVPFNEEGTKEKTIEIAKEIAQREDMVAVIGFSNSKRAIHSIQYVSDAEIPIVSSAGSSKIFAKDKNNIFFTTNFGIKGEILYLEKFVKEKGYEKVLFISKDADNYSNQYYEETKKIIDNCKKYDPDALIDSFDLIQKEITQKTLVIVSIDVASNAKVAKTLRDHGIDNDIFLGRGGIVGGEFYHEGGYGLKNIYELSTLLAGASNETILKFKNDNKAFFKIPENANYLEYAAYGYDALHLIAQAYSRTSYQKQTDPKAIRQNIKKGLSLITEQNPYDGVTTSYSFDTHRVGGKLTPQYILQSTGKKASLYKKQYIYQNGDLTYVPTLFTNIDMKSIEINNQEASQYTVDMMITLISQGDIILDDLEFENIVISASSFKPSIYAKEFIVNKLSDPRGMKVKIYNVKAFFRWGNTIENFPFDSQKLPILIKPKNPVDKNFVNYFISDIDSNMKNVDIAGWSIDGGYAGFKKGSYGYINSDLEKQKEYYYRSSYTIDVTRLAISSAIKFILPLFIVLLVTIVLFALPDHASGDKVGSGTNMLITVAALYFTYATLVGVDYITLVDKLFMFSLSFVLLTNILFILRQRFESRCTDYKCAHKVSNITYGLTFIFSIITFLGAIVFFVYKANF